MSAVDLDEIERALRGERAVTYTQRIDWLTALVARVRELEAELEVPSADEIERIYQEEIADPKVKAEIDAAAERFTASMRIGAMQERARIIAKLREIRTGCDGWREDALRSFADELERSPCHDEHVSSGSRVTSTATHSPRTCTRMRSCRAIHEVEAAPKSSWLERSLASASAEVARWTREKQEAMRVHPGGANLNTTLAALEGALAGWRMRALLAEADRAEALVEHERREAQVDHAVAHLQQLFEGERDRAYTAGRRDGKAVAAHQHELARDVLRAADEWLDAGAQKPALRERLTDAVCRWFDAGRPGLGGER